MHPTSLLKDARRLVVGIVQLENIVATSFRAEQVLGTTKMERLTRRSELQALLAIGRWFKSSTTDAQRAYTQRICEQERRHVPEAVLSDASFFSLETRISDSSDLNSFPGSADDLKLSVWSVLIEQFRKGRRINGRLFE